MALNLNATALAFKALHKPGNPLVLANVYDTTSALALAAHPHCRALATASYAIAAANGLRDQDLTLDNHLPLLAQIAAIANKAGKPFTVDLQDGYDERIEEAVRAVIALGAVGINLEDSDHVTGEMMGVETAVERVKRALQAAREEGVPDFVVNARSDAFMMGGTLDEAVERGKQYLEAGATTAYVFPGPAKNIDEKGVEMVVRELGGMVNLAVRVVGVGPEDLTSKDLARFGVARISVGPQLYLAAAHALKTAAELTFQGVV
ncbi:phosphoenolpyruvate phosphomutase-domain-containing protein [Podospora aff. communis PSN243]|uniref:Phosphoenolpyruvate phosphomutase-domain-containing protein n=1 Tax=Podospora aff. communis PSN243 TaxID=3040156 RepID=A0AAV9GRR5_9PEZI|nr:phosphoenolpyruvate phosphomutase-domain-containing protein [Podospora aff. communis PSN243]